MPRCGSTTATSLHICSKKKKKKGTQSPSEKEKKRKKRPKRTHMFEEKEKKGTQSPSEKETKKKKIRPKRTQLVNLYCRQTLYNVTYQLTPRTSTVLPSTAAVVVVVVFVFFFVFRFWVAVLAC